jgi:aryl-alcohol dehydrogenase-like predicted oxidoreductase
VTLGTSDLSVSATGVGAWAWGDRSGYWTDDWKGQRVENLEAYKTLLRSGVDFIDTAEVYGFGKSEELLAEFAKDVAGETDLAAPALATKFAPIPFRWSAEDVPRALEASLKRLGAKKTALYMQHWPAFGFGADGCNERFLEGLCLCYERGLCDAVGVSNFNADRVKAAARVFKARGVPFASNQIQYSLVYRAPELDTGVIEACREHGVTPVAYSPMAQGLLTGKYSASASAQSVKGPRGGIFTESRLSDVDGLIQTLREVGDVHGKTPAQVAVNWCMAKGTVPIPGAKNASQAASVAGCLGWRVSEAEMQALEKAAAMAPKSPGAPFEKW